MTPTADPATDPVGWRFDNTFARLPDVLFAAAEPARVRDPKVAVLNHRLAAELGLDLWAMAPETAAAVFAGQTRPAGAQPIAQAYAGHQFGGFTMLGDGRAILVGEHRTPNRGLVDIQLKGPGRTRFSRGGDGRAALGPMLREYIISEAMAALGVPTTRSLAVVTTGEPVFRETIRRGAVLTRVAASHVRVGTFQYAAARRDEPALRALADWAIARHDPDLIDVPASEKYLAFFRAVAARQAELVARWQLVGFVHGVLNTDNVAVSGETIDYGPCAFVNAYDPDTVFSSIDHAGRYAFGNQPDITQWNLARFAEALLPLIDADQEKAVDRVMEVLNAFPAAFATHWLGGMGRKLGLAEVGPGDGERIQELLDWMTATRADFTNTFRDLTAGELGDARYSDPTFRAWHAAWRDRIAADGPAAFSRMRAANPVVIPRNHRVEEALAAAEERDDFAPLHRLVEVLSEPFTPRDGLESFQEPPPDDGAYRTFCGT